MVKEEVAVEFGTERVLEELNELTRDAAEVQRQTLRRILEENGDAEYLQRCGLRGRTDVESFRECVPVVTHQDLDPYIQRVADGEPHVLTSKPMERMSLSSGTTQGKPKYIPFNEDLALTTMEIYRTSFALRNRDFPISNSKGKALLFIYGSKQSLTKGGLVAATATTNVYCSRHFSTTLSQIKSVAVSPPEVIFSPDFHQSLYCHLLCSLLFREEVQVISSTFAHSIILAFRALEVLLEELCKDIRLGILSDKITVPSIREAVSKLLYPNPELANLIYNKCKGLTNWYGVIPELWPNAKYVLGIMTGSMEPYLKKLRHYAGNLPLVSSDYGASEGWIGVNADPKAPSESVKFVVLPHIGFFEFIPLQKGARKDKHEEVKVVGLEGVEEGKEYEVVLTNVAGLYRYRLGDVVRVVGFYNSSPLLKFIRRRSLLLNINIDKNTETDLQLAVEEAGKLLAAEKLEVIDFTSLADQSTDPGHYVIFWELNKDTSEELLLDCCNRLDQAFLDPGYVSSRRVRGIGPLELRVVKKGTFNKIMEHFVEMGTTASQFKTPRCIGPMNARLLKILGDSVIGRYFSTAYD